MAGLTKEKRVGMNTYKIKCAQCGKEWIYYGMISEYKYRLTYYYINKYGGYASRRAFTCSWTCYVKCLLDSTASKKTLDDNDVLLLLKYRRPVPWEKVSKAAVDSLPRRSVLEAMYG